MTRSEALLARVRTLAARCPHGAIQAAALEMADEYEIAVAQALKAEATIHEMTKGER
jgi:hypothetical protein